MTFLVRIPPPQVTEHTVQFPAIHSGHCLEKQFFFAAGLVALRHEVVVLVLQVTFLVCIPLPQEEEQVLHCPAIQYGHGLLLHSLFTLGLLVSLQVKEFPVTQETLRTRKPSPQLTLQGLQLPAVHSGQAGLSQTFVEGGFVDDRQRPPLQETILLWNPTSQVTEQALHCPVVHLLQGGCRQIFITLGL